jgi:hypothetical protein
MNALKPIQIQVAKPVLLSGPALRLVPTLVEHFQGELHVIVMLHLCYLSKENVAGREVGPGVRISLTRLQRQVPFFGRRRLIEILKDLQVQGMISVHRSKRVNVYVPDKGWVEMFGCDVQPDNESKASTYIVVPRLAEKVGLKGAIMLQQIHIRCHKSDGGMFVIRSLEQWHSEIFPFWGASTVKRIVQRLHESNLISKRPYTQEDGGIVMSYRVNYVGLADLLGVTCPCVENPHKKGHSKWDKDWENWTNPVTLKKQSDMPCAPL